jgi:hypothetical protein
MITEMKFRVHKRRGIIFPAELLPSSQEGIYSSEILTG